MTDLPPAPSTAPGRTDAKRLALFLPHLEWGGAERVILDLSREFVEADLDVDLVLAGSGGALLNEVPEGVRIVELGRSRVATALIPLVTYLKGEKPDVVLSTLEHTNVLALIAAPFARSTRVVIREANTASMDTDRSSTRNRILFEMMRRTYATARRVIAVSEGVAEELQVKMRLAPDRIVVIPNPVLTPSFRAKAEREPEDPELFVDQAEAPVVLAVGRMAPQKDFPTLLRAFAQVATRTSAKLVILGEGPLRAELEELARELGIADRLHMPGFRQNPFAYMSRADVFVLSSAWEGLPNVLIQALAAGAPVVATDCRSGPREILAGGKFGHLVPVGDPDNMATAILTALAGDNPQVPQEWIDRFRSDRVARAYLQAMGLP